MRILMFVLALLTFVLALLAGAVSSGGVAGIQGFILLVVSAVLFVGAALVEAVNRARDSFERLASALERERERQNMRPLDSIKPLPVRD